MFDAACSTVFHADSDADFFLHVGASFEVDGCDRLKQSSIIAIAM